jgi:hypothetical protein
MPRLKLVAPPSFNWQQFILNHHRLLNEARMIFPSCLGRKLVHLYIHRLLECGFFYPFGGKKPTCIMSHLFSDMKCCLNKASGGINIDYIVRTKMKKLLDSTEKVLRRDPIHLKKRYNIRLVRSFHVFLGFD